MKDNPEKPAPPPPDWRAAARDAYEAQQDHWVRAALHRAGLPLERATLIEFPKARLARVTIDGETFRVVASPFGRTHGALGPHVLLERPCPVCGGVLVSPWIDSPAQLHDRLTHWQPRHLSCAIRAKGDEDA